MFAIRLPTASMPRGSLMAALSLLACCLFSAARADYLLDVGDVIEISVATAPELQRRVVIGLDGTISYPLLGSVTVAGLSPSQAQAKIKAGLANRILQLRTSDGRRTDVVIDPEAVTATVAEYRPIYVNGDVGKPGEYPYRLRMTARQAVALAGGYDTIRLRTNNPNLDLADLKSEYASLLIDFAKERVRTWRLNAELGDSEAFDKRLVEDLPLPRSQLDEIIRLETQNLSARKTDQQREKEFLKRAIKQGFDQIAVVSEQQQKEQQGVNADTEELRKDLDLLSKGTLISPRVTDARRAVLFSWTQKLQTDVELMQLNKQQEEIQRRLEQLDDQRRIEVLGELQDSNVRLGAIRAKLQGVEEKVGITGLLRSQLLADGEAIGPEIAVIRKGEKGLLRLDAAEDTQLQPGDVVEVSIHRPTATQ